jgi:CheY-like chemotaxis protein
LELEEKIHSIKADYAQIEQVLMNLLINASDAMPHGGVIFIKTKNVHHDEITDKVYIPKPGNYVLLEVRDTGSGMDKKTMDRIFEPFFTTKGLAKGTGLGLASAYGIVKSHGGYIDVESQLGQGTRFNIYIPTTEKVIQIEKIPDAGILEGNETVLLIDDEDTIIDVGCQMLEALGYNTISAKGSYEAIELLKVYRDRIDIVLLDMIMPGMGVEETYNSLQAIKPGVKTVICSGYGLEGQAQKMLQKGCDGFIQKPFDIKALSQKLREFLEQV